MTSSFKPEPGALLGDRYRLEQELGEGGMGVVYCATQLNLGRECALKLMHAEYAAREGARARFEREARVASQLDHPNVVRIFDVGEQQGVLYIAMEMLKGHTLRDRIHQKGRLDTATTIEIGAQLADVLVAAHGLGLVHRDLKPENIFLEEDPQRGLRVVVVDFGLAFIEDGVDMGRLTREGIVTGTPDYLSPEQARGKVLTPATDLYSFGCVLFEMITGKAPFEGDPATVIARHMFLDPPSFRDIESEVKVPGALEELVRRLLAKAPGDRPAAPAVLHSLSALDPQASERMGRGRDGGGALGRAARMVSRPPANSVAPTEVALQAPPSPTTRAQVLVAGVLDEDLRLALAANQLDARPLDEAAEPGAADAIVALSSGVAALTPLVALGVPIIADADASDISRFSELLRVGVAEVEIRPIAANKLAKKIWRAIRKARRRE